MTGVTGGLGIAHLVVFAGAPGVGKSAISAVVATRLGAALVSVDPVEAAMWRAGISRTEPTGLAAYVVAEVVAAEQLRRGTSVVIDAVNSHPLARQQWLDLGALGGSPVTFVEVVLPDLDEHRARLAGRSRDIEGFPEPSWDDALARLRELGQWHGTRLVLDSRLPIAENGDRVVGWVSAPPE